MERSKEIVVVDASVVAKWFLEEEYTKKALLIKEDYIDGLIDLHSTHLMPFEVLNALRYSKEFGQRDLEKAADALSHYRIALHPMLDELKEICIKCSLRYGITIYDSSYLSLSLLLNKQLYTSDEKLLLKIKEERTANHISQYRSQRTKI